MNTTPNVQATSDTVAVRIPPPLIVLALVAAGIGLHLAYPVRLLPGRWLALALGLAVIAGGLGLKIAAIVTLRRAETDHTCLKPSTRIVDHGPFRRSRNPIYLAVMIEFVGVSVAVNTVWLLVLTPILFLYFRRVVGREEQYLERVFGEEYRRYRRGTRRWI